MDFGDSFPAPPIRYAFDDGESDSEGEMPVAATIKVEWEQPLPDQATVIIGLEGPGSIYLQSLKSNTVQTGRVVYEHDGHSETSPILQVKDSTVFVLPLQTKITEQDAPVAANALIQGFQPGLKRVLLLDAFTGADYIATTRQDVYPPFLRVLQTSTAYATANLSELEQPNMIRDLSAALLTKCEIRQLPCLALLSFQELYLGKHIVTSDTLDAYAQGLNQADLRLPYDEQRMNEALKKRRSGRVDHNHHRLYL